MQKSILALFACAAVWVLLACGNTSEDHGGTGGGTGAGGGSSQAPLQVGDRCTSTGECDPELECFSEFFFERHVCTKSCSAPGDCPDGAECVADVPDYDGQLIGPYCLRPCELAADCNQSDCDTHEPLTRRYCF